MSEKDQDYLQEMMEKIYVCIEQSHNEQVQLEAVQYSEFVDKIIDRNFKIGVIKEAPLTFEKLSDYNVLIIGTPKETYFSPTEIEEIKKFVYNGGGLLLLSDQGGDGVNKNNLSQLGAQFGIKFNTNVLYDSRSRSTEDEQLIIVNDFYNHFILRDIEKIALKSPCSLEAFSVEGVENNVVAHSSPRIDVFEWNGLEWVEKGIKKNSMVVVAKYGAGKIVAVGTTRVLSSLISKKHGFKAADNEKFLNNILAWLVNREIYDDKGKLKSVFVNVSIKPDLYFWIEKELKESQLKDISFRDFNEIVNVAIESFKRGMEKYRRG
ncbi:MAG: DUF4350 domain-containing protein [Candidatus Hodarchaeota archaeon]